MAEHKSDIYIPWAIGTYMRTSNKLLTIGIIALAVVAFSIPISSYYSDSHNLKKNTEGPLIHVSTVIEDADAAPFQDYTGSSLNLSNVSVAIFSPVPDSLNSSQAFNLTGMNQTSNPYEVRLFQGHASSDGIINAHISTEFFSIVREWLADIQNNNTDQVSMMMYASYTHEYNNSIYVYSYYNNIPIDPRIPALLEPGSELQSPFNISLYFDLSSPSQIISLNGSNVISMIKAGTPEGQIGPPGGGSCRTQTDYTTVYDRTFTTELPEMAAVLGSGSNSQLDYSFSSFSGSLEMSFNSVSKNTMDSYAVQSSLPSWSGKDSSFTSNSGAGASDPTSNHNTSIIGISGVSIHVVATEIVYQGPDGSSCEYTRGGTTTSITVTGVSDNNFNSSSIFLSTLANSPYWWAIVNSMSMKSVSTISISAGNSYQSWSFTGYADGYTNAADAEISAENAVSVTIASVGFGLAIGVAAGVIPGADSAVDAVDLVNEALAGASLDLAILSAFSSISYSTTLVMKYNSITVANQPYSGTGSNFIANVYEASTQTQIDFSSGVYNLNMPVALVEANV